MSKVYVDMINTGVSEYVVGAYSETLTTRELASKIANEAPMVLRTFSGDNSIIVNKSTYKNFLFVLIKESNIKKEG